MNGGLTPNDHVPPVTHYTKAKVRRDGHKPYKWRTVYSTGKKSKGTFSVTKGVSNSVKGSVGMSKKGLSATLGFNVTKSRSVTVRIPYKTDGRSMERVQYAERWIRYKVTRVKTVTKGIYGYRTSKTKLTAYVYKFGGIVSRVIRG